MFLRRTERKKDGKSHSYWSSVENKRVGRGRTVQRHVLYLGEINSSQAAAWRKAIEAVAWLQATIRRGCRPSADDGAVRRG